MKTTNEGCKRMIVKVTKTEFITEDGTKHPIPFELDSVPTVEEFQEIYDHWLTVFREQGLLKEDNGKLS